MSTERRRIVYFPKINAQPITLKDFEDGTTFFSQRDSFKVERPDRKTVFAQSNRRYGGGLAVQETHDNAILSFTAFVAGTSADHVNGVMEATLSIIESTRRDIFFEWRPEGASASIFYEIRGPGVWKLGYSRPLYAGADAWLCEIAIPVAPLATGLPMDFDDSFQYTTDLSEWTFNAGSGTASVVNNRLVPSTTANKFMRIPQRGYTYGDDELTVHFTTGAAVTNTDIRCIIKLLGTTDNYLYARQTGSQLSCGKVAAGGALTALGTYSIGLSANGEYWLKVRIEGNLLIAEHHLNDPLTGVATPNGSAVYALSAAEAAIWGKGIRGEVAVFWTPHATDETIIDIRNRPYTYVGGVWPTDGIATPEAINLDGTIPGTAPAKVDIAGAGGAGYPWALFGWTPKPEAHNKIIHGNGVATNWSVAAFTGVTAVATSVTSTTSLIRLFPGSITVGEVVTTAAINSGAHYKLYGTFKKGVPYTARCWLKATSGTTNANIALGVNGDVAASTAVALSTAWALHTVTWIPTADRTDPVLALRVTSAAVQTFQFDGAYVGEGLSTIPEHLYGVGARPPFGVFYPAEADSQFVWAVSGRTVTVANPTTCRTIFYVDPSLMQPDDFTDTIDVEVWVRYTLASTATNPTFTAYAYPEGGGSSASRYTPEFGSSGRVVTKPSAGSATRLTRLGTITLPVNKQDRSRWATVVQFTGSGTGTVTFNEMYIIPARSRCCGPTGKPLDSSYAQWTNNVLDNKTIRSDLSGFNRGTGKPLAEAPGLGGSMIEFPPGNMAAFVKISDRVPDDPTSNTNSETTGIDAAFHFAVTPRFWAVR